MNAKDRIVVALDTNDLDEVRHLVCKLKDHVGMFKIGLELIHLFGGLRVVKIVHGLGGQVMYDPKIADIPTTVSKSMAGISRYGVRFCTVFAPAGLASIEAAVENQGDTLMIGVTVLTTMDESACRATYNMSLDDAVLRFADQSKIGGCRGIVCSPEEIRLIRNSPTVSDLVLFTPGVRPKWASANDQKRVMTPGEAIKSGANYLVIGRPITHPPANVGNPLDATLLIIDEIEVALTEKQKAPA